MCLIARVGVKGIIQNGVLLALRNARHIGIVSYRLRKEMASVKGWKIGRVEGLHDKTEGDNEQIVVELFTFWSFIRLLFTVHVLMKDERFLVVEGMFLTTERNVATLGWKQTSLSMCGNCLATSERRMQTFSFFLYTLFYLFILFSWLCLFLRFLFCRLFEWW